MSPHPGGVRGIPLRARDPAGAPAAPIIVGVLNIICTSPAQGNSSNSRSRTEYNPKIHNPRAVWTAQVLPKVTLLGLATGQPGPEFRGKCEEFPYLHRKFLALFYPGAQHRPQPSPVRGIPLRAHGASTGIIRPSRYQVANYQIHTQYEHIRLRSRCLRTGRSAKARRRDGVIIRLARPTDDAGGHCRAPRRSPYPAQTLIKEMTPWHS